MRAVARVEKAKLQRLQQLQEVLDSLKKRSQDTAAELDTSTS